MLQIWTGIREFRPLKIVRNGVKIVPLEPIEKASKMTIDGGYTVRTWNAVYNRNGRTERIYVRPYGNIVDITV